MVLTTEGLGLILAAAAGLLALAALAWALALQRKVNRLLAGPGGTAGGDGAGIDQALQSQAQALAETKTKTETLAEQVAELRHTIPHALQHVGVVRFNPFSDTGSDQSFAIAVLDDRGDGLVLSALYSRGNVRIYAKPVLGSRSEYALSEEEEQAIGRAMA